MKTEAELEGKRVLKVRCKAQVLGEVVECIGNLVDEAKFHFAKDGLSLRAVDPAHVAMVELTLQKAGFLDFASGEHDLGIDIGKLKDVLKLAGAGDDVEVSLDDNANKIVCRIGNITRRMSLVDTANMTDPKVPKLDLPAVVTVPTAELEKGIRAAEAISDHVALVTDKDSFELLAEGDTDAVSLKLGKDVLPGIKASEQTKSLFSLDYFSNMVKAAKGSQTLTLNLGSDYPVRVEFDFAGGNGHVVYLLAPRIESE